MYVELFLCMFAKSIFHLDGFGGGGGAGLFGTLLFASGSGA
jgi:hypothetical protein